MGQARRRFGCFGTIRMAEWPNNFPADSEHDPESSLCWNVSVSKPLLLHIRHLDNLRALIIRCINDIFGPESNAGRSPVPCILNLDPLPWTGVLIIPITIICASRKIVESISTGAEE